MLRADGCVSDSLMVEDYTNTLSCVLLKHSFIKCMYNVPCFTLMVNVQVWDGPMREEINNYVIRLVPYMIFSLVNSNILPFSSDLQNVSPCTSLIKKKSYLRGWVFA